MRNFSRKLMAPLFFLASILLAMPALAISTQEDIQLIPELPPRGDFEVTFHPGKTVTKGQTVQVQFGVPLPPGILLSANLLALQINGVEVPIAAKETVYWHATEKRPKSVRSVLITTDITFQEVAPKTGKFVYGILRKANYTKTVPADPTSTWVSISQEVFPTEFTAAAGIREPKVYATFSPQWLDKSLLRTRAVPVGENDSMAWFDEAFIEFGKTAVNDVSSLVTAANRQLYETTADNWLFDRAQTLFGVYIRTGDVKWLRHAHRNAQFYKNNIDQNGYFKLKTADLKYVYGQSMLIDLMLTGDQSHETPIKNVAKYTATWKETYTFGMNFWTERHQAYALLGALSAWELTGDASYMTRAKNIVHASLNQIKSPVNGWAPNSCILHSMRAHEGDAIDDPVCSGWMSALLGEAVWKYYIHTQDTKALEVLSHFGDFIENYITFVSQDKSFPGYKLPLYLASSVRKVNENGDWGAIEHTCDVGGFAARAALSKKMLGQDFKAIRQTAYDYLKSCQYNLNYWHRPNSAQNYGTADWRLNPSRKYTWWFGATLDYDWLLRSLDYADSRPMPPTELTATQLRASSTGGGTTTPTEPTTPTTPTTPPTEPTTPTTPTTPPTEPTTPTTPTTPAPVPSSPVSKVSFTNVTTKAIDQAPYVDFMFDVDFMHANDDGCWDLFVGSHGNEGVSSALYLQTKTQNKCSGNYKYLPNPKLDNYSQPTNSLRITGSYMFLDLDGNGTSDIFGFDVDGGAAGRYPNITPSGVFEAKYGPKITGCWGARNRCMPGDINGDGNIDLVGMNDTNKTNTGAVADEVYREIRDAVTGAVVYPKVSHTAGEGWGSAYTIFDVDNDTWPDIVDIWSLGYWKNTKGQLSWRSRVFNNPLLNDDTYGSGGGFTVILDYDADGDSDVMVLRVAYAASGTGRVVLMRNNGDGTFTDVSDKTGLNDLKYVSYWSTYGHITVADLNNDGFPDVVYAGESYKGTVTILWNNGNGSFTRDQPAFGEATNGKPRVALADYDGDGWVDIAKTNAKTDATHDSVALWKNNGGVANNWMNVRIKGPGKNTEGLGTRLVWKVGGTNQVITSYEVHMSPWFSQMIPHAGLGKNTNVDLEVYFPHNGPKYVFKSVAVNRNITVDSKGVLTAN